MSHYLQYTCNDLKIQAQAFQGVEKKIKCNYCTTSAIATVKKQLPSSPHFTGLYCSHCHLWLKWLPKPKVDATSILRSQLIGMLLSSPNFKLNNEQQQFFKRVRDSKSLSPKQFDRLEQILNELDGRADAISRLNCQLKTSNKKSLANK